MTSRRNARRSPAGCRKTSQAATNIRTKFRIPRVAPHESPRSPRGRATGRPVHGRGGKRALSSALSSVSARASLRRPFLRDRRSCRRTPCRMPPQVHASIPGSPSRLPCSWPAWPVTRVPRVSPLRRRARPAVPAVRRRRSPSRDWSEPCPARVRRSRLRPATASVSTIRATTFEDGGCADVKRGALLEVEGSLAPYGVVLADRLRIASDGPGAVGLLT